jgi:nucleoside-diphosphate-sugar epimerase
VARIFLTGATGYIGLALSRRLAADGHELRALVRETSVTGPLEELGVALFEGDVTDRFSMREAMSGADWVIHAAADLDFHAPEQRMRRINVEGSENVASLAYKLGVGRFLSISSIAYFGGSAPDGAASVESSPSALPFPSAYSATKHAGERAIRAWEEKGLRVNTVYPSLVYGPPGKKQGANALLRMILKGRVPAVVGGDRKATWVHLDDLVEGIARVMERAEPGAAFLMTGDRTSVAEMTRRVCELGGVEPPRFSLPIPLAQAALALAAPYYRLRGWKPPMPRDQLESLKRHWNFDDARARRELDWTPRSLDEGLPPTVEFLLSS